MHIPTVLDPGLIVVQAASTEADSKLIEALMIDVLRLAHADETALRIASAEQALGWYFYVMSVDVEVAMQLAQLPESGLLDAKGDSLGQKFVGWLK